MPLRTAAACAAALLLAGCSFMPGAKNRPADALAKELPRHGIVLLGEVHDNAEGHRLRTRALAEAVDGGWRPVIAMEQFDIERQADLDRALKTCRDADCVIAAASPAKTGWNWSYYRPVLELALKQKLPVVAANLSRTDAAAVMRNGLGATFTVERVRALGLASPPAGLMAAQRDEVAEAHCRALPATMLGGMAMAQLARDAVMADAVKTAHAQGTRPVVLLAGNGHVRRDLGAPRWLGQPAYAVGFLEEAAAPGRYDQTIALPVATREDPCKAFR
ncbi:ChaN family lipoprotein [Pigmentiphaga humi]|uniref:ChaN family lipoprotein n=1 Tax=Pigmentiphaga humi TaxID=2478468 RepID=UPI001FE29B9E|nr:ChaN family lipoprotein [Pigmentiphaga humi]